MSTDTRTASHAVEVPEAAHPQWIQLLPAGEFRGRDGRGPYRNDTPDAVLAAFQAWGMPLPVDYDHQSEAAGQKAGPVPAAGWIEELEVRAGEIWGRVTWTEQAAQALQAREYRFISPVYDYHKASGRVLRIVSAGLTNSPNLYLRAVASRQGALIVDKLLEELCQILNLPETATSEEVRGRVSALSAEIGTLRAAHATLARAAGLAEDAEVATVAQAIERAAAAAPDPEKWIPRAEFDRLAQSVTTLQGERTERLVRDAMSAGKVAPALEGWAREYASRDPEGFARYVAGAPVIGAPAEGLDRRPSSDSARALSETERAVCRALGLEEDEFRRARG